MTPIVAASAIPGIQIPATKPTTVKDLITSNVHHHSRGKLTPSRQSRMNFMGRMDIAISPVRTIANSATGHHGSGIRDIILLPASADGCENVVDGSAQLILISKAGRRPGK